MVLKTEPCISRFIYLDTYTSRLRSSAQNNLPPLARCSGVKGCRSDGGTIKHPRVTYPKAKTFKRPSIVRRRRTSHPGQEGWD